MKVQMTQFPYGGGMLVECSGAELDVLVKLFGKAQIVSDGYYPRIKDDNVSESRAVTVIQPIKPNVRFEVCTGEQVTKAVYDQTRAEIDRKNGDAEE